MNNDPEKYSFAKAFLKLFCKQKPLQNFWKKFYQNCFAEKRFAKEKGFFYMPMTKRYGSEMSTTDTTYMYLNATFRKGQRSSNWRKLKYVDKALYRAAMWYAKHRIIANEKLVGKLLALIAKLLETSGARVLSSGWGRYGERNEIIVQNAKVKFDYFSEFLNVINQDLIN